MNDMSWVALSAETSPAVALMSPLISWVGVSEMLSRKGCGPDGVWPACSSCRSIWGVVGCEMACSRAP